MPTPTTDFAKAMADAWNAGAVRRVIALAAQARAAMRKTPACCCCLVWRSRQAVTTRKPGDVPRVGADAPRGFRLLEQPGGHLPASRRSGRRRAGAGEGTVTGTGGCRCALQPRLALHPATALAAGPARLLDAVQLSPNFIEARLQAAYACYVCGDSTSQEAMLSGAIDWPARPADKRCCWRRCCPSRAIWTQHCTPGSAQLPGGPAAGICACASPRIERCCTERNNLV